MKTEKILLEKIENLKGSFIIRIQFGSAFNNPQMRMLNFNCLNLTECKKKTKLASKLFDNNNSTLKFITIEHSTRTKNFSLSTMFNNVVSIKVETQIT